MKCFFSLCAVLAMMVFSGCVKKSSSSHEIRTSQQEGSDAKVHQSDATASNHQDSYVASDENESKEEKEVRGICSKLEHPNPEKKLRADSYPGFTIDTCEVAFKNDDQIKKCIFEKGGEIDLAILYANGRYVKQDLPKALMYVCHGDVSAPMERFSMVRTLRKAIKEGKLEKAFDYCNHATASHSTAYCFVRKEEKVFQKIDQALGALRKTFTTEQKEKYDSLLKKALVFFETRAHNEQDLSGSARSIFITEWERDQRQWLLETLTAFEANEAIIAKADFSVLDRAMQEEYLKALKRAYPENYSFGGYIERKNIETTQQIFAPYRDAFAQFIHLRYPTISLDAAKAWITNVRTEQLKEILVEPTY